VKYKKINVTAYLPPILLGFATAGTSGLCISKLFQNLNYHQNL